MSCFLREHLYCNAIFLNGIILLAKHIQVVTVSHHLNIWEAIIIKKEQLTNKDKHLLSSYGLQNLNLAQAKRHLYEQDEFISHAGQPIGFLCFVVSGKAKVFISLTSGKQLVLAYFTSKGIIGDI